MKKIVSLLLSLLLVFQFSILNVSAKTITTKVKAGTTIPIALETEQTSKTVAVGHKLQAIIQEDVVVDNIVVFKKGDKATLNVVQNKKAGFVGIPGEMTISGGNIFDANNESHLIDFTQNYVGKEKTWPKVCLVCGVFIILAPLALFGFVKGGQAEIQPNMILQVRTVQEFDFVENL